MAVSFLCDNISDLTKIEFILRGFILMDLTNARQTILKRIDYCNS